jgi:hypothetical protein
MHRSVVLSLFLAVAVSGCSKADPKAAEAPQDAAKLNPDLPTLTNSPLPSEPDDPKVPRHTLRWETKGGHNLGYDIFRAESEAGPFQKVNERLVPGSGSRYSEVTRFEYADKTIEPGKTYWYYIEAVDLMNVRSRFTPVQRVDPKPAGAGAAKP